MILKGNETMSDTLLNLIFVDEAMNENNIPSKIKKQIISEISHQFLTQRNSDIFSQRK